MIPTSPRWPATTAGAAEPSVETSPRRRRMSRRRFRRRRRRSRRGRSQLRVAAAAVDAEEVVVDVDVVGQRRQDRQRRFRRIHSACPGISS